MANLSLVRVNQKLTQARLLLQNAHGIELSPVHNNAFMEAIAFHLVCAYQHYRHEIAETYGLKNISVFHSESDVIAAFEAAAKHPAEIQELLLLRQDADSWLAQLHNYYESLWQIPKPITVQETDDNLIDAIDLDAGKNSRPINLALLSEWHTIFVSLVQRQRETSAEF